MSGTSTSGIQMLNGFAKTLAEVVLLQADVQKYGPFVLPGKVLNYNVTFGLLKYFFQKTAKSCPRRIAARWKKPPTASLVRMRPIRPWPSSGATWTSTSCDLAKVDFVGMGGVEKKTVGVELKRCLLQKHQVRICWHNAMGQATWLENVFFFQKLWLHKTDVQLVLVWGTHWDVTLWTIETWKVT